MTEPVEAGNIAKQLANPYEEGHICTHHPEPLTRKEAERLSQTAMLVVSGITHAVNRLLPEGTHQPDWLHGLRTALASHDPCALEILFVDMIL